jgi:uncharacterized membrane protein
MKGRDLLQRPGADQIALALVPLLLVYLSILASWGWRVADWPTVMRLPPTYVLTVGVLIGLRRGTPPWVYSWLAQTLYNVSPLAGTLLAMALLPPSGMIANEVQAVFIMSNQGFNQLLVFLALVSSLLFVKRSRQDALFFFFLFLGARAVTFPIQVSGTLIIPSDVITGVLAIIALAEGAVMAVLLYQFLTGDPASWRVVWWLLILVLLDPLLKLWPLAIQVGYLGSNLRTFGIALGIAWLFTIGFFAVVYVSVWLYQTHRLRRA